MLQKIAEIKIYTEGQRLIDVSGEIKRFVDLSGKLFCTRGRKNNKFVPRARTIPQKDFPYLLSSNI